MAMTKPIISLNSYGSYTPFPSNLDELVSFTVVGGDQVTQNRLIIYLNSDNSVVYDNTVTSFVLSHTIPASILLNGQIYNMKIATGNIDNVFSDYSDIVVFTPLSTPVIQFTNVSSGGVINNSTFNFEISYYQAQSEPLQSYGFYLYDSNQNLLSESGDIIYAQNNSLQYEFTGLENGQSYYIKAYILTQHYISTDTSMIPFIAQYLTPTINSVLTLTNVPQEGAVKIHGEVIQIIGENTGTISYTNNEEVDITTSGSQVYWQDNFSITGDFTISIWLRKIADDVAFFTLYDPSGTIKLFYNQNRIDCYITMGSVTAYVYVDNIIINSDNDIVFIFLQKHNEFIGIQGQVN